MHPKELINDAQIAGSRPVYPVHVGDRVGAAVGIAVGEAEGAVVGVAVGVAVGVVVGIADGAAVGIVVGTPVGVVVGTAVGAPVGVTVGKAVGDAVGASVHALQCPTDAYVRLMSRPKTASSHNIFKQWICDTEAM